jgi:hypothetical protein
MAFALYFSIRCGAITIVLVHTGQLLHFHALLGNPVTSSASEGLVVIVLLHWNMAFPRASRWADESRTFRPKTSSSILPILRSS